MSPVLAEIMKKWVEEKFDEENRIRNFKRYADDSIDIWRGKREYLERKVKSMEDNKKGIKLKLEFEENSKITFLDVEITRGKNGRISSSERKKTQE